jgi:DNA-directed RNA polymerase specialized sigma24 family protein
MVSNLANAHVKYTADPTDEMVNELMSAVTEYSISVCLKRSICMTDAQEVAQETALKVWQRLKEYDPTRSAFKTWVHRCTLDAISINRRKAEALAKNVEGQRLTRYTYRAPDPLLLTEVRTAAGKNVDLVDLVMSLGDVSAAAKKLNISTKAAYRRLERIKVELFSQGRGKSFVLLP